MRGSTLVTPTGVAHAVTRNSRNSKRAMPRFMLAALLSTLIKRALTLTVFDLSKEVIEVKTEEDG
jgi:hypothetical protein